MPKDIAVVPGSPTEVFDQVRAVMARHGISQAQVAREADLAASTLSQALASKYPGDLAPIASKLSAWLAMRDRHAAMTSVIPEQPSFVLTPTAERIMTLLEYCHAFGALGLVVGGAETNGSGFGKSMTIRQYRATHPRVYVVTATSITGAPGDMLEDLAHDMGLGEIPKYPPTLLREIIARLRDSRALLVMDEAQHLGVKALEAARAIRDATGCGLVMSGNISLVERMYGAGKQKKDFAQLFGRVGKLVKLTAPSPGDIDPIAAQYGFVDPESLKYLRARARRHGAIRACVELMRHAATIAHGEALTKGTAPAPSLVHLQAAAADVPVFDEVA